MHDESGAECPHMTLVLDCSPHAADAGFVRKTDKQLSAAASSTGRAANKTKLAVREPSTYPAPLVMPGDLLAEWPKADAQSFRAWSQAKSTNAVTPERRTIYVADIPPIDDSVKHIKTWAQPTVGRSKVKSSAPSACEVVEYISAFYTPLPVKRLSTLRFTAWPSSPPTSRTQTPALALHDTTNDSLTQIATRASPASSKSPFSHQLGINPLIDALIESLPPDAYALLLLLEHDLFEDAEDDFGIGRAYGCSRVAVVSAARYNPALDAREGLDPAHAWPGSHCADFVSRMCETNLTGVSVPAPSPMGAAVAAQRSESSDVRRRWLHRVCKTASHELGHCFGIEHCVFYACIMQGTSGVAEDAEQPPYLCPVDLAKVLHATGASEEMWLAALVRVCALIGSGGGFDALGAWCRARLGEVQRV